MRRSSGPGARRTGHSFAQLGSASTHVTESAELPLLQSIKVRDLYRIAVTWRDGHGSDIDLAPHILRYAIYRPLRDDLEAFKQAEIVDDGVAVSWAEYCLDISADAIAAMERMQGMSADEFHSRLSGSRLSFDAAAATFGISRRQIAYFAAGAKPIPRYVTLALRGFEAELARSLKLDPSISLSSTKSSDLLTLHTRLMEELRSRNILRSANNPTGDLAEYLFCRAFGWTQANNSQAGFDAIESKVGTRYQIKGRRTTRHNASRQLSAIRELRDDPFDYLAGVVFTEDYRIQRAAIIPREIVESLAKFVKRTNSFRFVLSDDVWEHTGVRDVTAKLQAVAL